MQAFATIVKAENGWLIHFPARGATPEHTFVNSDSSWIVGIHGPIMGQAEAPAVQQAAGDTRA